MTGLLEACLRIPTVVFTVALGIVLLYWLFVLVGALDIDLFGGDASGAAKGLGDAFAGAKGVGDVLAGGGEGVGGVGEALAGSGDGAGDARGSGDGATDGVKVDGDHPAVGGGFWDALGLATVPITISFSVVVVVSWALSILGMYYGGKLLGPDSILLAFGVFVATVVVGIPLAGLLVRPLNPIFKLRAGKSNRDYVGALCSITTGQVNRDFGQATIEDGGTVLVIAVVCDKPEALKRGDRALIIEFDSVRHAYVVESVNDPALLP
jgi:hypothetical protein